jgi:large subunit ribosomal protein L6
MSCQTCRRRNRLLGLLEYKTLKLDQGDEIMSRIGKLPISFNDKIKIDFKDHLLVVKGPKGEMKYQTPDEVNLKIENSIIEVVADYESADGRRIGGTARSIIFNMVHGVSEGFTKILDLVGVGYRAQVQGQKLTLSLGFSHPIEYELPKVVGGQVDANTKITLTSCDKQVLGQVAAEIRRYRPPEPYKGKGILFSGEVIRRKAGKTAKTTT